MPINTRMAAGHPKLSCVDRSLFDLIKMQILMGAVWRLRFCISNKLSGEAATGPEITFGAVKPSLCLSHRRTWFSPGKLRLSDNGPNPITQEGRNGLAFGKLLPSQDTSNQLANGTLKDLGDSMFLSKRVIYHSYQREQPQRLGCLPGTL